MKNTYKIISLGGSIIIPQDGFNLEFLARFRSMILKRVKKGEKFVLVVGGGATCRQYQQALRKIDSKLTNNDLDWMGIYTTYYNAEFVKLMFKEWAYKDIVKNPTQKITTSKPIIVAGGWKPGCSTDNGAVLLAKNFGAREAMNLSNIDYVYDSDPRINPNAKKLENISWDELRKIVGDKWEPGANVPFDPIAAKTAQKLKLKVLFAKGTDLEQVEKALSGKKYNGTVIQ